MFSHPYILPGEGPNAGFGAAESIAEYVNFFNLFVFYYVFNILFTPFSLFFLPFLNEWPSRVAPFVRLPPVAEMTPRDKHALCF